MTYGISRVHGAAGTPSQRPSTLSFFTINFGSINILRDATTGPVTVVNGVSKHSDVTVPNGALDQIFRTAVPTVATVGMIGTPASDSIRFAIEDTGADAESPSFLGGSPANNVTTAAALQAAIRLLGTVNGIDLTGVTVAAFTL